MGGRIAEGDHEGAAPQFVEEVAYGPGAWDNELLPKSRAIFVQNAPTFLDELRGPNPYNIEEEAISRPVRRTNGSEGPPIFARVIDRLVELIPR